MTRRALYWLTNDLRLEDNATLVNACKNSDELLFVYCVDPQWFGVNDFGLRGISHFRWQFLLQALRDLNSALRERGQELLICYQNPVDAIAQLAERYRINAVYRSFNSSYNENEYWRVLKQRVPAASFHEFDTYTLYDREQLNFSLEYMPATFAEFHRKVIPSLPIKHAVAAPKRFPAKPSGVSYELPELPELVEQTEMPYVGGETYGQAQLKDYFSSSYPQQYLELSKSMDVRDRWHSSSKLSAWLAIGNISVRKVVEELEYYQRKVAENRSTEQLFEELIWREFFQWYALAHGARLFHRNGVAGRAPSSNFDAATFDSWCKGETQYPIVNACMRQLNRIGSISNAGREVVASCLIYELGVDWRYGAAYFEQQLVDHDVALNWGNWQYLAGVSSDPNGAKHLDLDEQARRCDPDGDFMRRWSSNDKASPFPGTDSADWPVQ